MLVCRLRSKATVTAKGGHNYTIILSFVSKEENSYPWQCDHADSFHTVLCYCNQCKKMLPINLHQVLSLKTYQLQ